MHIKIRHLIAIRDGEPVDASVIAHLHECRRCEDQLRQLRQLQAALRELPEETPPPHLWQEISGCHEADQGGRKNSVRWPEVYVAVAASFLMLSVTAVLLVEFRPDTNRGARFATVTEVSELDELQQQSRNLESMLQRYRMPAVVSMNTASAVGDLEDSIAMIDFHLEENDLSETQRRSLWQRRVELMETLMTVRAAERRAGSI